MAPRPYVWQVVARHITFIVGGRIASDQTVGKAGCAAALGLLLTCALLCTTRRSSFVPRDGTLLDMSLGRRIRAQRLRRNVVTAFQLSVPPRV
jgi:hypothetical protein